MVLFDGETPEEETVTTDEGVDTPDVDTKKVDRVMKVFEALSPEEQQAAFVRMEEIVGDTVSPEGEAPGGEAPVEGGEPMTEGMPFADDQAVGSPFGALQERLKGGI